MPRVNIWIRNEDWDRWQAITNKPEWLHEHLNDIGIRTAVALEDIKQGQAGTVYASLTKTEFPDLASEALPTPPKCPICGNYHFGGDLQAIKQWHDSITYTQPEDTA